MHKTDTKFNKTTSEHTIRTTRKTPVRSFSKPEFDTPTKTYPDTTSTKQGRKPEKKCITTKTVIINNKDVDQRDFIVDLQRSKSSREPTPDRLCPVPLSSDEDSGIPRYPDEVVEPDEGSLRRKPKKLSDIPIMESEDTIEFTRFSEVTDKKKITEVDKVEETDESLLSVNKKISKFLDTADKLTKEPLKPAGPAPKVGRPKLEVTEDLQSDECLLSVSDKVSKFITTAEQLITPQHLSERPKSPKCQNYIKDLEETTHNVSEKVSQFINNSNDVSQLKKPSQISAPKVLRPDFTYVDEKIREDECLLSVSDKVSKFISTADKLTTIDLKKPVSLAKIDIKPKSEPTRKSPERKSPTRFVPSEFVETGEQTYTRKYSLSPERYSPIRRSQSPSPDEKTPTRRPSNQYTSITSTETQQTKYSRRDSSPKLPDTTPKSGRRPSQEEPKPVLSPTGRLRSTESIKKAKALFESITKEQEVSKQRDILNRPSVFEGRKLTQPDDKDTIPAPKETKMVPRKRLSYSDEDDEKHTVTTHKSFTTAKDDHLKSTKLVLQKLRSGTQSPEKDRSRSRSPEKLPEIVTTRSIDRDPSPDYGDVPHYMLPLDRSLRPNSPHRDNITQPTGPTSHPTQPSGRGEPKTTKFGVTLRRTDSGRTLTTSTAITASSERRKSSITLEKRITEEEIEDIFDLEVLEELVSFSTYLHKM
ncbi:hypothetical protein NQ314_015786 [Rhamnusium bicolor]|uniref:Uncharacterized protein n=1 Tax=Rhamnusium bicolor TaxID=1586634 RepID=A0AAV8WXG9_9CUCU|nr:hypothetical protein NQ314_015786 [Rhamnusium bicolor]